MIDGGEPSLPDRRIRNQIVAVACRSTNEEWQAAIGVGEPESQLKAGEQEKWKGKRDPEEEGLATSSAPTAIIHADLYGSKRWFDKTGGEAYV